MTKLFTIPEELLEKIEPYPGGKKDIKDWVIRLPDGMFLHWIETTNNCPMRIGRADMTMQRWRFKEEAEFICGQLKKLWSAERLKREARPDCKEFFDINKETIISVTIPDDEIEESEE